MSLYAIGDLHLSFSSDKPMDIFGENWANYEEKLKANWLELIKPEDTVILLGDTSWALRLEEAKADLAWIEDLPGKKILIKGNHDYWWSSVTKMKRQHPELDFIFNTYAVYNDVAICGTRGWISPPETGEFSEEDKRIYQRELLRFEHSLEAARKGGHTKIVAVLHYPPHNDKKQPNDFVALCRRYGVETIMYGHLHTSAGFESGLIGEYDGLRYVLTSSDYLDFKPLRIL